jgi:hypothetical protein
MAVNLDGGAEIRLSSEDREQLGSKFKDWFERVSEDRRSRMTEVWVKALDNYEGKAPVKQFPWPGASNAFIPVTGTHCDAIAARLYAAATAQSPIFLVRHNRAGSIKGTGVAESDGSSSEGMNPDQSVRDIPTWEEVASWWQNISTWVEKNEVIAKEFMEDVVLTYVVYGDAYVYLPWEVLMTMDVGLDLDTNKLIKTERPLIDQPRAKVVHPKDVYVEWDDEDIQMASQVGIAWNLDSTTIDMREASGYYSKADADKLRQLLTGREDHKKKELEEAFATKDGRFVSVAGEIFERDEYEKEIKKRMGVSDDAGMTELPMMTVFARVDLDRDGVPEEHIYEVVRTDGFVPYARYANYLHRERPLHHYYYSKRPGAAYNRGVAELLFNIQKVINQTIRDHLDNNKVQNTKMFLAKKGSPIEENAKVYPTRVFFVNDVEADFKSVDLGTGRPVTQINDIGILERWAQFITGITDFNLGQEKRSRTPASTTLALLEEGNKRIDRTIDIMRHRMQRMWRQVLMLYFQNGDPEILVDIALNEGSVEQRSKFMEAWEILQEDPQAFMSGLVFDAEVSSNALNKSVEQQRALAVFGQIDQFYQRMIQLSQAIGGALADPIMARLFLLMVKGYRRAMGTFLDAMEVKDQEVLNPDVLDKLLAQVTSVDVSGQTPPGTAGAANGSSPATVAQGNAAGVGPGPQPIEAEGRPGPGASRPAADSGAK